MWRSESMASLIAIESRRQKPLRDCIEGTIRSDIQEVGAKYPVIAKGNSIEGITAKE